MKIYSKMLIFLTLGLLCLPSTGSVIANASPYSNIGVIQTDQNSDINLLAPQISVADYDESDVVDGYNLFALRRADAGINGFNHGDVIVTSMDGTIIDSLSSPGNNRLSDPEMINSTTVFLRDDNPLFWNLETNVTEYFNFTAGGHDMEYNPITDTFLSKEWSDLGEYDGQEIRYNDLYEYDRDGNVLWYWNSTEHFPFNPEVADGQSQRGRVVWMHANSVFWDHENDAIYLGARGHDTFYKIDKTTGDVLWGVGKLGNFTLYDINGNEKDSLFYHQHAVELISENRFILYDNDYLNTTRENPSIGIPRLVEIEVDETNMEAREVWTYTAPAEYYGEPWGDADLLPKGNRLGVFGHNSHDAYLTEVNEAGEIVWELTIEQTEDNSWGMYRAERFYDTPVFGESSLDSDVLTLSFYDNIKSRIERSGTLTVLQNDNDLTSKSIIFNAHFQESTTTIDLSVLETTNDPLTIIIENEDGKQLEMTLNIFTSTTSSEPSNFNLIWASFLLIPILRKQSKLKLKSNY